MEAEFGLDFDSDDDDDADDRHAHYHLGGTRKIAVGDAVASNGLDLEFYASLLAPYLTAYWNAASLLSLLLTSDMSIKELTTEIHATAVTRVQRGGSPYPEATAIEMTRNCLKTLEVLEVVQTYPETDMIGLTDAYCKDESLLKRFVDKVYRFVP